MEWTRGRGKKRGGQGNIGGGECVHKKSNKSDIIYYLLVANEFDVIWLVSRVYSMLEPWNVPPAWDKVYWIVIVFSTDNYLTYKKDAIEKY